MKRFKRKSFLQADLKPGAHEASSELCHWLSARMTPESQWRCSPYTRCRWHSYESSVITPAPTLTLGLSRPQRLHLSLPWPEPCREKRSVTASCVFIASSARHMRSTCMLDSGSWLLSPAHLEPIALERRNYQTCLMLYTNGAVPSTHKKYPRTRSADGKILSDDGSLRRRCLV